MNIKTTKWCEIERDKEVWARLFWFYRISTIIGYLMPNTPYMYIYIYIYILNMSWLVGWLDFMAYRPLWVIRW